MTGPPLVAIVWALWGLWGLVSAPRTFEQRYSWYPPKVGVSVSRDGRVIAFESLAQLVAADTNRYSDVYVSSRDSGGLELVSVGVDGAARNGSSSTPRLSGDGRYVAFESVRSQQAEPCTTVFLRDRLRAMTRAVVALGGDPARIACAAHPAINGDGRWVAFESSAQDLVEGGDANGLASDVYLVDTQTGGIARISVTSDGRQSSVGSSYAPSIDATGRFVGFTSTACLDGSSGRPSTADPCLPQVYVRDLAAGTTRAINGPRGVAPNGAAFGAALSGDGRYVAFASLATNLARGDTNRSADVYVHDRATGSVELLSRTGDGKAGNGPSSRPAISESGRFVAFDSTASDLICARRCGPGGSDHNLVSDVFLLDRSAAEAGALRGEGGRLRRVSRECDGSPWWEQSAGPAIDGAGELVAFSSRHATDPGDLRADFDLFLWSASRGTGREPCR
jgi:Tol biopolymer transport system component